MTNPYPVSGMVLPRYSGLSTFMRLPYVPASEVKDIDVALMGLSWDGGTTTRNGSRYGPRQIREMSTLLRSVHPATGIDPYKLVRCADIGDAPTNPVDPMLSLKMLEDFVQEAFDKGARPLAFGGDHLISLPVLRVVGKDRPLGMIHFDAHTDMYDFYYENSRFTHGTPFRRAIEEGLLDPKRVVQIGIRGTMFAEDEYEWCMQQGITHIGMDFIRERGVDAVIAEARRIVGDQPTYLTFDIDCIDPSYAPGTGVPEIAGVTTYEAQRMLRGLRGLELAGADMVEVSPPIDPTGNTALVAANLSFEILCLLAESVARKEKPAA
ncbi:MAG: agmatinase [Mesorhizobium sp.]